MTEGWQNEDYFVLFDKKESADLTVRYELHNYLTGYKIVGIRGWDDFILEWSDGKLFTVPTVPLDPKYLSPLRLVIDPGLLKKDVRLHGKIKWYTKPIIFGGDPNVGANVTWIGLENHIQLVNWWNKLYQCMK